MKMKFKLRLPTKKKKKKRIKKARTLTRYPIIFGFQVAKKRSKYKTNKKR